jgi:propanediol dehydratase small subunit
MIRKMELVKVGDDLYEIVKKLPIQRFTKEVAGESADTLKQYYGVEKILKFNQTMEYLFVNKIEDLEIIP